MASRTGGGVDQEECMMTRWLYAAMVGLSAALVVGCGAEGGATEEGPGWENAQPLTLLAELQLEGDRTLEFYEAFEGGVVISGAGPVTSPPLELDHSLTPLQIFESLAPHREAPRELVEAQLRADSLAARIPERPRSLSAPEQPLQTEVARTSQAAFGDDDSACPFSWFQSVKCAGAQTCLGYVDGAKSVQDDDVMYSIGMSCNYRNGHNHVSQYRTWWSWASKGTWFVPPGAYRYTELWNTIDFDARVTVQANGPTPGSHIAMRSSEDPWRIGTP
jgi:hypothetical protein